MHLQHVGSRAGWHNTHGSQDWEVEQIEVDLAPFTVGVKAFVCLGLCDLWLVRCCLGKAPATRPMTNTQLVTLVKASFKENLKAQQTQEEVSSLA